MCIRCSSQNLAAAAVAFACHISNVNVDHMKLWEGASIEDSLGEYCIHIILGPSSLAELSKVKVGTVGLLAWLSIWMWKFQ